jgi:hypothetical protein
VCEVSALSVRLPGYSSTLALILAKASTTVCEPSGLSLGADCLLLLVDAESFTFFGLEVVSRDFRSNRSFGACWEHQRGANVNQFPFLV